MRNNNKILLKESEKQKQPSQYPIAQEIPQERLNEELKKLEILKQKSLFPRLWGYLKLGGPGFMGASLTLGAGTLTASMLSGAKFGYKTMWLIWFAMGLGLFMMAAMARFTCKGGFSIIKEQNKRHGWITGSFLTALIGTAAVAIFFNIGQYSVGTHLIESLTPLMGFEFSRQWNWILYMAITTVIILNYGRKGKGTAIVEKFMKWAIALMLLSFGACLIVVGVDFNAMLKGIFIPWLPGGGKGLDIFIASAAAAIGVIDWIFFHYAGHSRGWGRKHEPLARFDIVGGLFFPFVIINFMVIAVFAKTLHVQGISPDSAPELAKALTPLLGHTWSQILFYLGFLAVPITTTVGMGLACAMAIHEALGWKPDTASLRWKICALLPQLGFVGVWYPDPLFLLIIIGAAVTLSNNIVGWSMYMLLNDKAVMGEDRSKSYLWNLGLMLQITLLNAMAIVWIFNKMGWWFK